jgi:23S rRNA (uracil1939-C5)-methyltransferase
MFPHTAHVESMAVFEFDPEAVPRAPEAASAEAAQA